MTPVLSIIIVNYRGCEWTIQCLESINRVPIKIPFEVIVVDNNSCDHSVVALQKFNTWITLIELTENRGFGAANNVGAARARGKYLFFLNNDTELVEDCFTPLVKYLEENSSIGVTAPQLRYPNGNFQLSYGTFPTPMSEYKVKRMQQCEHTLIPPEQPMNVDWVSGAAFCISRDLFTRIGGFDEHYFMYFEDVDLCKRVSTQGYYVVYVPSIRLLHHKGKSSRSTNSFILLEYRKSQIRYYRKYCSKFNNYVLNLYLLLKYALKYVMPKERAIATAVLKYLKSS
ncbi:MAG: glycosyltransferase family 2 protein [Bacteroidetes bacterium]|nr:glycosyltransferase family 2 protein [Bacteroidota bacterium]